MLAAFLRHQPPLLTATARKDQGQTLGDLQGFEIPLLPMERGMGVFVCYAGGFWCGSTRELGPGGRGF